MSEQLNAPGVEYQGQRPGERRPTEEELREFERMRDARVGGLSIEDFAKDPAHPTEVEIKAMNDYNMMQPRAFEKLSFEDFFGYPDLRGTDGEADQSESGQN